MFVDIDTYVMLIIEWSLGMAGGVLIAFAIARASSSGIGWRGHIEHDIVEVFIVVICACSVAAWFSSSWVLCIRGEFGILSVHIDKLVFLERHIFFDEIIHCFT